MVSRIAGVAVGVVACGNALGQVVLNAHPAPANNGGSAQSGFFFNLETLRGPLSITRIALATDAFPNQPIAFELYVREGSGLGGRVSVGPGSTPAGWTLLGTVEGVQGRIIEGISLPIDIPHISVVPGTVRGVAIKPLNCGLRFSGDSPGQYWVYQDDTLRLTTGDCRTNPFTAFGSLYSPRALVGYVVYTIGSTCNANCDGSSTPPVLNVSDFVCFQAAFAAGAPYADCDQNGALNVADFVCFEQQFAAGCP